jgi:hypothetical protein
MPRNLCLIGWADGVWVVSGPQSAFPHDRLERLLQFWDRRLQPLLPTQPFWTVCCLWDGWRERIPFSEQYQVVQAPDAGEMDEWRGAAGSIPAIGSALPVVACFAAHRGDPSALLLPDAHYLHDFHRVLFARTALSRRPWARKLPRAIFCGADHGELSNQLATTDAGHPIARRHLAQLAAAERLPVDVHLGERVSRRRQIGYRYLLDVDGEVHTWDAWAWKLRSGSVVLAQESIWETFFSRQFSAWEHFVPVANDFSDLANRLEWCVAHDRECRAIVRRAGERAATVYNPAAVAERCAAALRERLFRPA